MWSWLCIAATSGHPGLIRLAARQAGVITRTQLRQVGVTEMFFEHQLAKQRWTAVEQGIVLLQNAPPTRRQSMWIALLDGGPSAALGSHTSLELHGFRGFATEADLIHVVALRGRHTMPLDGVVVHESRRLLKMPVGVVAHLRCIDPVISVIDAAAWQPYPRFAVTMLAAAVQQKFATVERAR